MTSSIGRLRMLTRRRHGLHDAGRLWVRRIRSPRNDRVRCERRVEQLVGLHDHLLLDDEQRCHCSADVDATTCSIPSRLVGRDLATLGTCSLK